MHYGGTNHYGVTLESVNIGVYIMHERKNRQWPKPVDEPPNDDELQDMMFDGVVEATDGCEVEPDGVCPHGYPSWLIQLGIL